MKARFSIKISLATFRNFITIAAIFTIVYLLYSEANSIFLLIQETNILLFCLSILLAVSGSAVLAWIFYLELKFCAPFSVNSKVYTMGLFFIAQIIKYLPGKVWPMAFQASIFSKLDDVQCVIYANYGLTIFAMSSSLIVASIALITVNMPLYGTSVAGLALLIISSSQLFPKLIVFLSARLHWITKLNLNLCRIYPLHGKMLLMPPFIALNFFAFFFFFISIGLSPKMALFSIINYSIAWVVGIAVFVFPAGIGIRELAFVSMSLAANNSITSADYLLLAIYIRIWQVVQDLVGAGSFYLIRFFR